MAPKELDYLIIGPAHPFRGGIAETQHELAKALLEQGYTVTSAAHALGVTRKTLHKWQHRSGIKQIRWTQQVLRSAQTCFSP